MVGYSSSSIALTIIAGHFVFSSAKSSTSAFVPFVAARRSPLNFGKIGALAIGMLPRHGRLPLELRRRRPSSQIRAFQTTATNTKLCSQGCKSCYKSDSFLLEDHSSSDSWSKWQPVAVLLSHGVPVLLLGIFLYGQMQVCMCAADPCFGTIRKVSISVFMHMYPSLKQKPLFFDFGTTDRIKMHFFKL
jgi:hypothetical protein